jgi:hypothetical protein
VAAEIVHPRTDTSSDSDPDHFPIGPAFAQQRPRLPGHLRRRAAGEASRITEGMKLAAAEALTAVVADELSADNIIPSPFDERVTPAVTTAVAAAARVEGVARR